MLDSYNKDTSVVHVYRCIYSENQLRVQILPNKIRMVEYSFIKSLKR